MSYSGARVLHVLTGGAHGDLPCSPKQFLCHCDSSDIARQVKAPVVMHVVCNASTPLEANADCSDCCPPAHLAVTARRSVDRVWENDAKHTSPATSRAGVSLGGLAHVTSRPFMEAARNLAAVRSELLGPATSAAIRAGLLKSHPLFESDKSPLPLRVLLSPPLVPAIRTQAAMRSIFVAMGIHEKATVARNEPRRADPFTLGGAAVFSQAALDSAEACLRDAAPQCIAMLEALSPRSSGGGGCGGRDGQRRQARTRSAAVRERAEEKALYAAVMGVARWGELIAVIATARRAVVETGAALEQARVKAAAILAGFEETIRRLPAEEIELPAPEAPPKQPADENESDSSDDDDGDAGNDEDG